MKLRWNPLASNSRKNGIIVGFKIGYAVKATVPKVWLYHDVDSAGVRLVTLQSLKKYTVYEFSVAAKTSKGVGAYCPAIETRTKEDGRPQLLKFLQLEVHLSIGIF